MILISHLTKNLTSYLKIKELKLLVMIEIIQIIQIIQIIHKSTSHNLHSNNRAHY